MLNRVQFKGPRESSIADVPVAVLELCLPFKASTFQAKREAQIQADEAATEKKRAKRQKRKDAKAKNLQMKKEADGINQFCT
eukprot:Skav209281  [mRNA]  locus=scaffold1552:403466:403887:+ [translate_table: standard]